jgi:hypothetical protein
MNINSSFVYFSPKFKANNVKLELLDKDIGVKSVEFMRMMDFSNTLLIEFEEKSMRKWLASTRAARRWEKLCYRVNDRNCNMLKSN